VAGIAILFAEELKAIMRGRYAWLGAGVILFAIGVVATAGTQDTWLDRHLKGLTAVLDVSRGCLQL